MIKIYLPTIDFASTNRLQLFVFTRPFYTPEGWKNDYTLKERWGISENFCYTDSLENADVMFLPMSVNFFYNNGMQQKLKEYNTQCLNHGIKVYGYISGDFGIAFPDLSQFTYFRLGGFKSQLSAKNIGLPVTLSDHFQRLYQQKDPTIQDKTKKPVIGFCGHATASSKKRFFEYLKFLKENIRRFFISPLRRDYEPLFASAYERWKLLHYLKVDSDLDCRFIFREKYRGGAQNQRDRDVTTQEYYDNIYLADYVLCVRGAGNFSVRLYETLMMGKIPIFVNTDCLLPFNEHIDWKKHVVWVEWKDREKIAKVVKNFHDSLTNTEFREIQSRNRELWKNQLSVGGMLTILASDF